MKVILILCGLILAGAVTAFFVLRPKSNACICGENLRGLEPAALAQVIGKPEDFLKKDIKIEGTVVRQCPHCTCWLLVRDAAGHELRVEAGDLGHPVPYRPGRNVVVEGRLIRYGEGYEFVATAVEFR
jgi:hypothetical protein